MKGKDSMIIPRMKFEGCDSAKQMSRIFAENLQDLLNKADDGKGGFEQGFIHTSTLLHEGTCYYGDIWSRDAGRGLIELARYGFAEQALNTASYFLRHKNYGDHWGRTVQGIDSSKYEIDGNALVLLGIARTWWTSGRKKETGKEFLEGTMPVFEWMERLMEACPYGYLLPCESELSGNPDTPYQVYAIYPNYGARAAMRAFNIIARLSGMEREGEYIDKIEKKLSASLSDRLVSKGQSILTPQGCWINGLDGRDGRPYEFSEWGGTSWPVYHWTRQVPYILSSDMGGYGLPKDDFHSVNLQSYQYILDQMCTGKYFRKYGFVSNSGWTGMGERHDDTMCGYGQGFMTQAALMVDDINTYTKLMEGVARLAYDGDVLQPLTFEMNPWIMHECFNYENYEEGYDHTFGVISEGRPGVMDNPGDEGNLVQEAEIIKALALVAGIDNSNPTHLRIMPRLPWTWDEMLVKDYPVLDEHGYLGRLEFRMVHERWLRKSCFSIMSSIPLKNVDVRLGPFPAYMEIDMSGSMAVEKTSGGSWVWIKGLSGEKIECEIVLKK